MYFDFPALMTRIFLTCGAAMDRSFELEDKLIPDLLGFRKQFFTSIREDDGLRHSVSVSQIDEQSFSMVACRVHPTAEGHGLFDVFRSQFAAGMCSIQLSDLRNERSQMQV